MKDKENDEETQKNEIEIGHLILKSSNETMDNLIKKAKELLRDEACKDYLIRIRDDLLKGKGYYG